MQIKGRRHLKINANGTADTNSPAIGLWNRDARPGTTLARLETAYLSGIEVFDRMQTRSREHAASGKLTPDGVKQALVQSALGEAVPSLHRSRQTIKNAKSELAELRARVKPPASDNTDLVSAMLRAEMRDWLRSKPQAERDKITVNAETMDAALAMAIMEMPAEVTGVSAMHRNAVIQRAVEAEHGEIIAEIEDLDQGIQAAERAVEASRSEIAKDCGIDAETFNELAAPIEQKAVAPWLKKFNENGAEVVKTIRMDANGKTGTWQHASQEEIANGIHAATFEEFQAKKVA